MVNMWPFGTLFTSHSLFSNPALQWRWVDVGVAEEGGVVGEGGGAEVVVVVVVVDLRGDDSRCPHTPAHVHSSFAIYYIIIIYRS